MIAQYALGSVSCPCVLSVFCFLCFRKDGNTSFPAELLSQGEMMRRHNPESEKKM